MKFKLLALLYIVAAAAWAGNPEASDSVAPDSLEVKRLPRTDYDGIDVSKYQGNIDWEAIANNENIKFVYIKATEGATYTDPKFERNIAEARKHGVKVGCYHFLRSSSTIHDQFENIKQHIRREEQTFVPMIDVETKGKWSNEQLVDSLHALAVKIYEYYHCAPIIYTYVNFYNRYLAGRFTNYPLFIARYTDDEPVLSDGTPYVIWQFSERGRVPGINGNVDLNRFGPGYSPHDIFIISQRIKGNMGIDISVEDLVMHSSVAQIKELPKLPDSSSKITQEELTKIRREMAKKGELDKKEAQRRAREEAKARREQAEQNAKRGIVAPAAKQKKAEKKANDDDESSFSEDIEKVKDGIGSFFSRLFGSSDDEEDDADEKKSAKTAEKASAAPEKEATTVTHSHEAADSVTIEIRARKTTNSDNPIRYSTRQRHE